MISKSVYKKLNLVPTICFLLIFVVSVISPQINRLSLYLLIPGLFVYSFLKDNRLVFKFRTLFLFVILFIWSLLTLVAANDISLSLVELRRILSIILLSYSIIYFSIKNKRYIELFYLLYIIRFFVLLYFGYTLGITSIDPTSERFSVEEINANMFGYYGFFAVVSSFFIMKFSFNTFEFKTKNNYYFWFTIIASVSALFSVFYAASRAGIVIVILTITLFCLYIYIYPISKKALFILFFSIIILSVIIPEILSQYYYGSYLEYRFTANENIEDESRTQLLKRAYEVGIQHPLFGVGPGNFVKYNIGGNFSHSTFFELFSNNGFLGLFIFIAILYNYLKTNLKLLRLKCLKDKKIAYLFLSFIFVFIVYNVFYVFHTSLFLMTFFFLVSVHMELFAKNRLKLNFKL